MKADVLTLTRVTKDMGSTIKPGPMVVAEPQCVLDDAALGDMVEAGGLNAPMLADLVVAMAAHENMAVNMFRVLQTVAVNPMLRSTYKDFEEDSLQCVGVLAELQEALGIPMYYISPAARMTEGMDSHMIMSFLEAGSADQLTIDMKTVEATLLGSTMCVANTNLLRKIGDEAEGEASTAIANAVSQLEGPQAKHLAWAEQTQQRMVLTMIKHPLTKKLTEWTEQAIAKVTGKAP